MKTGNQTVFIVGTADQGLLESLETLCLPCRHFESVDGVLHATDADSAGCVIANLQLFGIGGFDVLQQLAIARSTLPVVIISRKLSTRMVVQAMREGASTVLESPTANEDLYFAIRNAMKENEERVHKEQQSKALRTKFGKLSVGEQQVIDQLCSGCSNKEIAVKLNVHVRTVEARKKRILEKTRCESIAQLLISYQSFRNSCRDAPGFGFAPNYPNLTPLTPSVT